MNSKMLKFPKFGIHYNTQTRIHMWKAREITPTFYNDHVFFPRHFCSEVPIYQNELKGKYASKVDDCLS